MYLSNTRLISMLFVLAGLTFGLLWLLNKQAHLPSPTALNAEEPVQLVARQPAVDNNAATAIPELEPAKETIALTNSNTAGAAAKLQAEPPLEVAAIPEHLVLSEKELKALSSKDRKHYEQMMGSLRSLHDQSTQLTSERQRLEQQMAELEKRNQELAKQLEQVRQTTETTAENKTKP